MPKPPKTPDAAAVPAPSEPTSRCAGCPDAACGGCVVPDPEVRVALSPRQRELIEGAHRDLTQLRMQEQFVQERMDAIVALIAEQHRFDARQCLGFDPQQGHLVFRAPTPQGA